MCAYKSLHVQAFWTHPTARRYVACHAAAVAAVAVAAVAVVGTVHVSEVIGTVPGAVYAHVCAHASLDARAAFGCRGAAAVTRDVLLRCDAHGRGTPCANTGRTSCVHVLRCWALCRLRADGGPRCRRRRHY